MGQDERAVSEPPHLTIVIPTRNRQPYLHRLLDYYAGAKCCCPILIGDASDEAQWGESAMVINGYGEMLDVTHVRFPAGLEIYQTVSRLLDQVATPYTVLLADDDFLVPAGLAQAVQFLEHHSDYSVAYGAACLMKLTRDGPYGLVRWMEPCPYRSVEQDSGRARLLDQLAHYQSIVFSVQRTQTMRVSYQAAVSQQLDYRFAELLTACLPLLWGKAKKVDGLYLVRQVHAEQDSLKSTTAFDSFDWITDTEWSRQYLQFRDCLASELAQQDVMSLHEARDVVKQAFWAYLAPSSREAWIDRYTPPHDGLRKWVRGIPGVLAAWHSVRALIPGLEPELSLPALLRASSRYHQDFMPIYRLITTPAPDIWAYELPSNVDVAGRSP